MARMVLGGHGPKPTVAPITGQRMCHSRMGVGYILDSGDSPGKTASMVFPGSSYVPRGHQSVQRGAPGCVVTRTFSVRPASITPSGLAMAIRNPRAVPEKKTPSGLAMASLFQISGNSCFDSESRRPFFWIQGSGS